MIDGNPPQEAWLHAYVDDELAPADRHELLQLLLYDKQLRAQICDLQRTKELVRQAFIEPPLPQTVQVDKAPASAWRRMAAIAAVIALMAISFAGGLFADGMGKQPSLQATLNRMGAVSLHKLGLGSDPNRVLMHIASENNLAFAHTLKQASQLLQSYGKHGLVVELVVNGGALQLLEAKDNPYSTRIHALLKQYPNLHIVACGVGLDYLQSRSGFPIDLMQQVQVAPSAVEEIVKRLREGWVYVKA